MNDIALSTSTSASTPADQPLLDTTPYGNGPDDSVTDTSETEAVTHHIAVLPGKTIPYTATAGHLVTIDASHSLPAAKVFYVAFTADGTASATRPVTFFYNGGPGSSSVWVLLGSYAPRRIKTNMPGFTPPAPYTLEDNPDTLLDRSDLVFINPIGTGYSTAIAPNKNRDFWGVDQDATSIKQFIKRYLTKYDRWNSPLFLFGESYGTARSCVLAWLLHEDGIDLNGITLQSSILDYTKYGNPVGLLPTLAADAFYHQKIAVSPPPSDLPSFMDTVASFAQGPYATALADPAHADPGTVQRLSDYTGIPVDTLKGWGLDVSSGNSMGLLFLVVLMQAEGVALGAYDGRVTAVDTGIAGSIDPNSGGNDPTMTAVSGVYTRMWNYYLNDELKFTATSAFTDLNTQAFTYWDFGHIDPTGTQKGGKDSQGNPLLYTAGDLAATMALNPNLKVLSANGYFDSVTPFLQTTLDLANMPLANSAIRQNLTVKYYPSGHMIYLDGNSRTALKADLAALYDVSVASHALRARVLARQRSCVPYFKRAAFKPVPRAAAAARPWSVPDLCQAYDWPTGLAGGGRIAIIELDGGWIRSDMDAFFSSIGQPTPEILDVSVDGTRNNPNQHIGNPRDPDLEVALDIQVAGAAYYAATGQAATIRVYWVSASSLTSIATAVRRAAADGCDTCSISWGADEALWQHASHQVGKDLIKDMELAATDATAAGMVVFAASGDNDSSDGGPDPTNVDVPSSCPHVVACGGTTKTATTETVWNDNPGQTGGEGTGGGYSRYFPQQSFQAGVPNGPGRMVPDIAANADDRITPYKIFVHGSDEQVGGTSAVAPLYAGLFAAFGTKLGFVSPQLWANHLCFNDITQGDNGFYRARIGPDPCTGLGSPIGTKLAALFGARSAVAERAAAAAIASPPTVPAGWSGTIWYEIADGAVIKTAKVPAARARKGRARHARAGTDA